MDESRKPTKEYSARIWVKLTDDILPQPVMSTAEVQAYLNEALNPGNADSPIASIKVEDPRNTTKRRY